MRTAGSAITALSLGPAGEAVFGDDVTVTGNLTVNGTATTIDTTNLLIEDPLMLLARTQSGTPTLDSGLIIERGSSTNVGMIWDESGDEFAFINTTDTATTAGNVSIASYAPLRTASLIASGLTVTGDVIFRHNADSPAGYAAGTDLAVFGSHNSTGTLFEVFTQGDISRFKILGSGATTVNGALTGTTIALSTNTSAASLSITNNGSGDLINVETSKFVVNSGGEIGIGTTSPAQKLHIHNGRIAVSDGYNIGDPESNNGMFIDGDQVLWQTAGATRIKISAAGHLIPNANGTYNLGGSGNYWKNCYFEDTYINGPLTVTGILDVAQYIRHQGDTNTQLNLESSQITIRTSGGCAMSFNNDESLYFYTSTSMTQALKLDTSQNATFAGDIILSDTTGILKATNDLQIYADNSKVIEMWTSGSDYILSLIHI